MLRKTGSLIHAAAVSIAVGIMVKVLSSLQIRLLRSRDEKYLGRAKDDS